MSLARPLRLLLLGAPGSGKGTQTSKLLKKFPSISSISSGDVLRSQISQRTSIGVKASSYIRNGQLVPDAIICDLIASELKARSWLNSESTWLLDGFPRTFNQATELNRIISTHTSELNLVVELDVDERVILERIENRWVHIPSGRIYNLQYNPPKVPFKDDLTGEPLSKRDDDNPETFKRRLDQYHREIDPLKEFYRQKNVLYKVSGDSSDIIFPKLAELVLAKFG